MFLNSWHSHYGQMCLFSMTRQSVDVCPCWPFYIVISIINPFIWNQEHWPYKEPICEDHLCFRQNITFNCRTFLFLSFPFIWLECFSRALFFSFSIISLLVLSGFALWYYFLACEQSSRFEDMGQKMGIIGFY